MRTAGQTVNEVNSAFMGMTGNPTISAEQFADYTGICQGVTLDRDVVAAFNAGKQSEVWLTEARRALDLQMPDGTYLFRRTGYTAVLGSSGVEAIHTAPFHLEQPVTPDPVEEAHGSYAHMALVKAGRALADSKSSGIEWSTLGQAYGRGRYVGVTGGLFMHGNSKLPDVREQLRDALPVTVQVGKDDKPVDYLAGMADQIRAEAVLGTGMGDNSVQEIAKRVIALTRAEVNVH